MQDAGYLFAAFTVIWVFFFGYLLLLHNRQRKLHRELESLQEVFEEKTPED
jgi:CcmD family protein